MPKRLDNFGIKAVIRVWASSTSDMALSDRPISSYHGRQMGKRTSARGAQSDAVAKRHLARTIFRAAQHRPQW